MILTAHQPAYLPWLGLFHKIAISDVYCYMDNVQYIKEDWINRNRIKTPDGAIMLTVPVHKKGYMKKLISEIEIDNSADWRRKHWLTIINAYKKSPYFKYYSDFFEDTYARDYRYLSELTEIILRFLLKELDIKTKFIKLSDLNISGSKNDLIINICKEEKADIYVFGAMGKDYAEEEKFLVNGISVYFQEYNHPVYPQLWGDFISHLSVLDILFNVEKEKVLDTIMGKNVGKDELYKLVAGRNL